MTASTSASAAQTPGNTGTDFGTALDYKKYWEGEIRRCKALGLEVPNPVPHPEDISVDMVTGTIVIKGPMTPEEKVSWDHLWDHVDVCNREIDGKRCSEPTFIDDV